jgi:hypothetical protein
MLITKAYFFLLLYVDSFNHKNLRTLDTRLHDCNINDAALAGSKLTLLAFQKDKHPNNQYKRMNESGFTKVTIRHKFCNYNFNKSM